MQPFFLFYFTAVNLASFVVCAWDIWCARRGAWRIPERTLLLLCAAGGSPAFLLGMVLFHHKTRKAKFLYGVPVILTLQIVMLFIIKQYLQ